MGFLGGFWGVKSKLFDDFRVEKEGAFRGFTLIEDGFWVKYGGFPGKFEKRGGLMSGAAARTGDLR